MLKVALVRGKYLNNFEGQNFIFNRKVIDLAAVSSLRPLHKTFPFNVIRLPSIADIGDFSVLRYISNRIFGDSQVLFGLEKIAPKFDIFHAADPHYYYSYQLAKLRRKKLVSKLLLTSWETIPFNNESVKKKRFIKRYTMKSADYFVCYTERARKCLIKEGIDEGKIKVIKLGVDLTRFKKQGVRSKKQFTVLFAGRLVVEKGILDLYEAFKKAKSEKLKTKNNNLKLKIVGEGTLEGKLKKMIRRDSLIDSVSIERRSYEEMPKIYQKADIFIMPSKTTKTWEEQYGMALIEAFSSGLPIVAYNSGAIAENLNDLGLLIKEGDIDALTQSINSLIKDADLRAKLGTMGRRRAERLFDCRKTARELLRLYESISSHSH